MGTKEFIIVLVFITFVGIASFADRYARNTYLEKPETKKESVEYEIKTVKSGEFVLFADDKEVMRAKSKEECDNVLKHIKNAQKE